MSDSFGAIADTDLAQFDIAGMLGAGLSGEAEVVRRDLFGIGAVGAAVILDRLGTFPRSLSYLAEVVRAGGVRYAAELAEPLPEPAQIAVIRPWLTAAVGVGDSVDVDDVMARWLRAVATVLVVRSAGR